jgi:hypothetical protein
MILKEMNHRYQRRKIIAIVKQVNSTSKRR